MTKTKRELRMLEAQLRTPQVDAAQVGDPAPLDTRAIVGHLTYPGDVSTSIPGEVFGEASGFGEDLVAATATFDPAAGTTRVGFALATVPDVVVHNRRVDAILAGRSRLRELLTGLRVGA